MVSKLEQNAQGSANKPVSPSAEVLAKLGKALGVYFVIVWGDIDEDAQIIFRPKKDPGAK